MNQGWAGSELGCVLLRPSYSGVLVHPMNKSQSRHSVGCVPATTAEKTSSETIVLRDIYLRFVRQLLERRLRKDT